MATSDVSSLTMSRNTTQSLAMGTPCGHGGGLRNRRRVRVIVLEGAGTAFVSGADISQFDDEHANVDAVKAYGTSAARGYGCSACEEADHRENGWLLLRWWSGIAICRHPDMFDNSVFAFPPQASVGYGLIIPSWLILWDRPLRRRSSIRGAGSMRRKLA